MRFHEFVAKKENSYKVTCRGEAGQTLRNLLYHIKNADGKVRIVIDVKDRDEETLMLHSSDVSDVRVEQIVTVESSRIEKVKELIKTLAKHGNCGHSYGIEVYTPKGQKRFGIDGDGADYIKVT